MLNVMNTQPPKNLKICVVGDLCLDRTIYVKNSTRANPENPDAPLFKVVGEKEQHGMGFNVYKALCSLTSQYQVREHLRGNTEKTRIVDADTGIQLYRLDDDYNYYAHSNMFKDQYVSESDVIVVSDYCKGAVDDESLEGLVNLEIPIYIDTKKVAIQRFARPWVTFKINQTEFDNLIDWPSLGCQYMPGETIVTRGDRGCQVYSRDLGRSYIHAGFKTNCVDVCGAGDMFLAGYVFANAITSILSEQLDIANAYAALSVTKQGVYIPTLKELQDFLSEQYDKINR